MLSPGRALQTGGASGLDWRGCRAPEVEPIGQLGREQTVAPCVSCGPVCLDTPLRLRRDPSEAGLVGSAAPPGSPSLLILPTSFFPPLPRSPHSWTSSRRSLSLYLLLNLILRSFGPPLTSLSPLSSTPTIPRSQPPFSCPHPSSLPPRLFPTSRPSLVPTPGPSPGPPLLSLLHPSRRAPPPSAPFTLLPPFPARLAEAAVWTP